MIKLNRLTGAELHKRASAVNYSNDLISPGRVSSKSISRDDSNAHVRHYIPITPPCVNDALCGDAYSNAVTILGISAKEFRGLLQFTLCIERSTGLFVKVEDACGEVDDYAFNGEAVLYLIDKLNIAEIIEESLHSIAKKVLVKEATFSLEQTPSKYPLLGNWYIHTDIEYEGLQQLIDSVVMKNSTSVRRAIAYTNLMNTFGSEEAVKEHLHYLVVDNLVTLPFNLRLQREKRKHPLTVMYDRINNLHKECENFRNSDITKFVSFYKELYTCVKAVILVKSENKYRDDAWDKLRPIAQEIGKKEGAIRQSNLSKRQDYSGRAAVVVNPYIPLNYVGIPKSMVPKLYRHYEYKYIDLEDRRKLYECRDNNSMDEVIFDLLEKNGVIDSVPALLGRNPTLHKHGIQGFHVVFIEGSAIEVSPLVCPAFNMDFDGDTAHVGIPLTDKAISEINNLILTDKNLLLAKTGECTVCPRMDILYGLYQCTKSDYKISNPIASYNSLEDVKYDIFDQHIEVWDTVSAEGRIDIAGRLAFISCFPDSFIQEAFEVTSSSIKAPIDTLTMGSSKVFVKTINALVELGFKTAYLYAQSVSVLRDLKSIESFDTAFDEFHRSMEDINELNDIGFYTSTTYSLEYGDRFEKAMKIKQESIYDKIGDDSMFWKMSKSGARGNSSNLMQMYAAKGRIRKSGNETINVAIENSYITQLSPMESFIAAIGAREGQISKSIKTSDTGYLERQIRHLVDSIVITCNDCGTKDGLVIRKSDIYSFLADFNSSEEDKKKAEKTTQETFAFFIKGRYEAEQGYYITHNMAKALSEDTNVKSIKIRSPLKCKNPCCKMCYGDDTTTRQAPVVGMPVGIIAAQSVGEMLTQTTMKSFQGGGLAGKSDLTSDFDRIESLLSCTDVYAKYLKGNCPTYEPVAWNTGKVSKLMKPGGMCDLVIGESNKKLTVDSNMEVLSEVTKGQPMFSRRRDLNIEDAVKCAGIDYTQTYMVNALFQLFSTNAKLFIKHFEIIVGAMTGYIPISTDIPELKLGLRYSMIQLVRLNKDYSNTHFIPVIQGVKRSVLNSPNFLEGVIFENPKSALSNAMLHGLVDDASSPIVEMALGLPVKVGTGYNPRFMEEMNEVR